MHMNDIDLLCICSRFLKSLEYESQQIKACFELSNYRGMFAKNHMSKEMSIWCTATIHQPIFSE